MFNPPNRLSQFFPVEAPAPEPPSVADKLLAGCYGAKLELIRFEDDDGKTKCCVNYKLHGELSEGDAADVLLSLLAQFRTPRGEAGAT